MKKTVTLNDKTFEVMIPAHEIDRAVAAVAERLNADYGDKECPIFVGVLNGAFMFLSDLIKKIDFTCEISFVKLASYEGTCSTGNVECLLGLNNDIAGRHVIIVEDIVDTGRSIAHMYADLMRRNPASVEVCTLANNHALDFKEAGLNDTAANVMDAGMGAAGYKNAWYEEKDGVRVCFLAFTEWDYSADEVAARVREEKAGSNIVIVSMHWGIHFKEAVIAEYQRYYAHFAIDHGADLVLGHHAHILKPIEIYKGKAIFYSLGNLAMEEVTDMLRDQATLHQDMLTSKNHMEMTAISDGFKTTKRSFPMDCYYTMVAKWEVEQGKITKETGKMIRVKDFLKFFDTSARKRMAESARCGKLYKEQPFVLGVPASELYEQKTEEWILVQGIIDVYFEEEDGLVVLDYKTDRVSDEKELVNKYHAQLDYYAKALEQLTEKKVKEKLIYSFALGKEIRL